MMENYVIVDLETTGLDASKDKIIEIGALKIKENRQPEIYNVLINPQIPIPEKIVEIVGITDEMVQHERKIEEVMGEFLNFLEDLPLLGHNLIFDYGFLKMAAAKEKLPFEKKGLDTLDIARKYLSELKSRRLDYLCAYFGIKEERHHRAWNDVKVTKELYQILCDKFENLPDADARDFMPQDMRFTVKKDSPITAKQISFLNSLLERHGLTLDKDIKELSKSEASKKIDEILSKYGRY